MAITSPNTPAAGSHTASALRGRRGSSLAIRRDGQAAPSDCYGGQSPPGSWSCPTKTGSSAQLKLPDVVDTGDLIVGEISHALTARRRHGADMGCRQRGDRRRHRARPGPGRRSRPWMVGTGRYGNRGERLTSKRCWPGSHTSVSLVGATGFEPVTPRL